jgi:hypothetical protein
VLDESVYNMLSMHGDTSIAMIAETLRSSWTPVWAPVNEVVTVQTVAGAVDRLIALRRLKLDGDIVRIPVRDPRTRRGPLVRTDYKRACLVWKGR